MRRGGGNNDTGNNNMAIGGGALYHKLTGVENMASGQAARGSNALHEPGSLREACGCYVISGFDVMRCQG